MVIRTNRDAPNFRLVVIDIPEPAEENWITLIAVTKFKAKTYDFYKIHHKINKTFLQFRKTRMTCWFGQYACTRTNLSFLTFVTLR